MRKKEAPPSTAMPFGLVGHDWCVVNQREEDASHAHYSHRYRSGKLWAMLSQQRDYDADAAREYRAAA